MKKIIALLLLFIAFAFGADYKPFEFTNITNDPALQQEQFDYMLKYKLYGYEYFKMGGNNDIPDSSGWSGTAHNLTTTDQVELGGPILAGGSISVGNGNKLTTGPIRATTFTMGNDNNISIFGGTMCLENTNVEDKVRTVVARSGGTITNVCPDVPEAPVNLTMPTIKWPDTISQSINVGNREVKYIDIPAVESYDLYINSITTGSSSELYFRMRDGGTLTRIFVNGSINLSDHTKIKVVYKTDSTDYIVPQNKFRGNLLFYTNEDFKIENTDYTELQGTFITTKKATLVSNIEFAGQILANELDIGNQFSGKNFRFVKFDPDTIDVKLDKYGGLLENDSTVIIPVELNDTTDINVYFTYCIDLKDGVTLDDFNQPSFPVCGKDSIRVVIPIGSKIPNIPIQINVAIDSLLDENDTLSLRISDITGAILPNGKTDGELRVPILDAIINKNYPIEISIAHTDSIPEDAAIGTKCGEVKASDGNGANVIYSITDTSEFKIDSITGEITSNTLLDYETKKDYKITVYIISADSSIKDTILDIHVKDVDEPVHAHNMTITVQENVKDTIIGKVTGEDEDGWPVKFYSNDTLHYFVDSITGTIRLVEPFDYETTKNDTLKVIVKDVNGNTDIATVVVEIENVNEPPVLQPNDTLHVPENCKNCEIIGIIKAIDPDPYDTLFYDVKESGFKIDNGVLTTTEAFDHETTPSVAITVVVKDSNGATNTKKYVITITDVNEPVHVEENTCKVKENYTGEICTIVGYDEDIPSTVKFDISDKTKYDIDDNGVISVIKPFDFETVNKDSVKVYVIDKRDSTIKDSAWIKIIVENVEEKVVITEWDKNPPPDTVKTNDPDHEYKWKICEGDSCTTHYDNPQIHKDTTIKVCNANKTVCDSIVVIFNDAPPVVTLTNAKSTDALIDYITIEEEKDDKIYVNKKENTLTVTVRDTVHKTEKSFPIDVKLDTVHVSSKNVTEYKYLIDEALATKTPIGGGLFELKEVVEVDGRKVTMTKIVDKNLDPADTVQTVTYTVKQDGKNLTITYKIDNLSGQRVTDYEVSYQVDSCTTVSYYLNDDKKIAKNKEGNIAYTITYEYTDDFGNKASSKVDIIFDNIPPKVEIFDPEHGQAYNTNAIPVKWTVNGETQDTLTLQRLEKGVNYVIRRYVDKAGNVAADTVMVIMKEAKDIDIELVHPVTKVDQDKVDEYYSDHKYNDKKPFDVKFVDPKNDTIPEVVGVGFKIDIVLPSVSPTGSLATLDDIVKNGQIPVDDKGNIVGASTKGIPVDKYVEEHCTEEFQKDYQKNGLNIPLYDVTYNLHLWVYTNAANYVNDFTVEFTLNDEAKTTSAGTVQMVIDWLADKDGHVKAKNGHGLGTGAYLTKLFSKSVAKHRCDYKEQRKGDRTVKKDETFKTFGYKRPIAK